MAARVRPGGISRARRIARAVAYGVVVAVLVSGLALLVRGHSNPLLRVDAAAILAATAVTLR